MFDWILDNKEWLFSGMGVAILAGIIGLLVKKPYKKSISKKSAEGKSGNDTYKPRPLPNEIHEDIKSRPELQKEDACKYYIGLKVRWRLKVRSITKNRGGSAKVILYEHKNIMVGVYCDVKLNDYPELNFLKQDHKVWINGEIEGADEWHIDLCKVSIEFD